MSAFEALRIAIVSDIHGNLPALEAVLADIAQRQVENVINLGDSLSGPLWPSETAKALRQLNWLHLAGNHERQVLTLAPERMGPSDAFARAQLDADALAWMASLHPSHRLNHEVFLCHGTPTSDVHYFLETADTHGIRMASAQELAERRGDTSAALLACGHTHIPRLMRSPDGCLYLNPGSVGLPAYDDDQPFPHWVENGSPDARYAIAERKPNGTWHGQLISVPYDFAIAAHKARQEGREDWAIALQTGYALR